MYQPIDAVLEGTAGLAGRPVSRYKTTVIGVDVGKIRDYTAICAVSYDDRLVSPCDPMFGERPIFETHYTVLGAQRLALDTSYPAVAKRVNTMAKRLYDRDSRGDYHVLCDATGVGRPVIDMIRASIIPQVHVTAVTLTGGSKGDDSILWREESSISKVWLVSRLQAILQGGRLHAPRDTLMQETIDELKVYEIRVRANGNEETGAFETGTHDDLATSLALACAAEHTPVTYGPTSNALPSPRL